jgi:hypothetical protein
MKTDTEVIFHDMVESKITDKAIIAICCHVHTGPDDPGFTRA